MIHNGLDLETFWDDLVEAGDPQGIVVDASDGVEVLGSDEEEADPHIWHDPIRAKTMVANLTEALVQADPEQAQGYRDRASAYVVELDRLDADIARQLSALPSDKIVTNHDAFGYYVDRYGLDFVGAIIPSFDSTAELSVDDVQRIVALIQAEDVRAVFSESDLPPKTAEAIGREAGVAVVAGEDALYGDSLGPPGSGAETYLDMMRHNTEVIVEHLA
jgi:zinc/manganese transport system substrate-binding protein/manganese/iron transport system substrate-binding protein